jgi:SAM-dependent methyltransferase
VATEDRVRWDRRHSAVEPEADAVGLSANFTRFAEVFPTAGHALDLACGRGQAAVWLAGRGMDVLGLDVSPVAVGRATELARVHGVAEQCRFEVADLDAGLPPGPPANIVVCQRFRDVRLDGAVIDRLTTGGLLAISALSEVGAGPGRFRVPSGELRRTFGALEVIADGEADGEAWLLARLSSWA